MDINYNVNSTQPCIAGHQFDNRANRIIFEGFEMRDASNELYLLLENASAKVRVGIVDYTFDVTTPLTVKGGKYNAQLEERTADDSLVAHSDVFTIIFKASIDADAEYEQTDIRMDTMYEKYNAKYNEVEDLRADLVEKVDEGYFDGKDGADGKDGKDGSNYEITSADYEAIAEKVKPYDDTEIRTELAEKVGFTDYATSSKGGVIKGNMSGFRLSNGEPYAQSRTFAEYKGDSNNLFIGKGTLENVLAERLKEPQFELIEEITLTEDAQYTSFNIDVPNKLLMVFSNPSGVYCGNNNPYVQFFNGSTKVMDIRYIAGNTNRCIAYFEKFGDMWLLLSYGTSNGYTISNRFDIKPIVADVEPKQVIIYGNGTTTPFTSGTNIKIYGIRA